MNCDDLMAAINPLICEPTLDGFRVVTQCLHPNFEPVAVYVQTHLDGFLVHDAGDGFDLVSLEGRSAKALEKFMREYSVQFGVETDGHRIFGRAISPDWLPNVMMAVANASAAATNAALRSEPDLMTVDDDDLKEHAYLVLRDAFTDNRVHRRIKKRGRTGKLFNFAFGVQIGEKYSLIDIVTPNPISVSSRFTSFTSVEALQHGGAFLTYDRKLSNEDQALLADVAVLTPINSLVERVEREMQTAVH